jgi:hypothetical protein
MPVKCERRVTLTFFYHSVAVALFDQSLTSLTKEQLGSVQRAVLTVLCVITVTFAHGRVRCTLWGLRRLSTVSKVTRRYCPQKLHVLTRATLHIGWPIRGQAGITPLKCCAVAGKGHGLLGAACVLLMRRGCVSHPADCLAVCVLWACVCQPGGSKLSCSLNSISRCWACCLATGIAAPVCMAVHADLSLFSYCGACHGHGAGLWHLRFRFGSCTATSCAQASPLATRQAWTY